MKKRNYIIIIALALMCCVNIMAETKQSDKKSGFPELDEWAQDIVSRKLNQLGYPVNQDIQLKEFYKWFIANDLEIVGLNNVGDPFTDNAALLSAHKFEREVLRFFAPLYGIDENDVWGLVSNSGTDGNNHGIYFGVNYLRNTTGKMPIMYVSDEAHYSNMRLADLQNLDLKLIKSDEMGRMIPEELEKELDTSRPVLMVYAMGSTFKGAIDNMEELNAILDKHSEIPAVYRHLDAALFGGYLPFTEYKDMVSHKKQRFESIAISGHKFFGIDSPSGLFLCTRTVYDSQNSFNVPYLNNNMRMINCSRDAIQPLKFWWLIQKVGKEEWSKQATAMMECTKYLADELEKIGWPHWVNDYSNTVFFTRPSQAIIDKYILAGGYDERFGGNLNHVVVMQQVTKEAIDGFIADLKKEPTAVPQIQASSSHSSTVKYIKDNEILISTPQATYHINGTISSVSLP